MKLFTLSFQLQAMSFLDSPMFCLLSEAANYSAAMSSLLRLSWSSSLASLTEKFNLTGALNIKEAHKMLLCLVH